MSPQNRQKKQVPARNIPLSAKPKKKLRITFVILLLAFVAIGSALLNHHHTQQLAIDKERAQFAQTEKDLDQLTASIVTNFGQPDTNLKSNSCAYASREFGKGPLGCSINYYVVYAAQTKDAATTLTGKIQQSMHSASYLKYTGHVIASSNNILPLDLGGEDYSDSKTALKCTTGYTYSEDFRALELEGYPKLNVNNPGLLLEITCGGSAKAAYYPLKN